MLSFHCFYCSEIWKPSTFQSSYSPGWFHYSLRWRNFVIKAHVKGMQKKQVAMDSIFVSTPNIPDHSYPPLLVFVSPKGLLPQAALLSQIPHISASHTLMCIGVSWASCESTDSDSRCSSGSRESAFPVGSQVMLMSRLMMNHILSSKT